MNIQDITPFEDFILVRPLKIQNETVGGIYVPESAKDRFSIVLAEVKAVGKGRMLECGQRREMDVSVGDTVMFSVQAPIFPLEESAIASINGQNLPPLALINIGHLLGTARVDTARLEYADSIPIGSEE